VDELVSRFTEEQCRIELSLNELCILLLELNPPGIKFILKFGWIKAGNPIAFLNDGAFIDYSFDGDLPDVKVAKLCWSKYLDGVLGFKFTCGFDLNFKWPPLNFCNDIGNISRLISSE